MSIGTCERCKMTNVTLNWLKITSEVKESKLELCNTCMDYARKTWQNYLAAARPKQDNMPELTDESSMYFGKHKDKKLKDVPAEYLLWVGDQVWVSSHPRLHRYIEHNRAALEEEVAENEG